MQNLCPLNLTAEPGNSVTLTCQVITKNQVTVVEWKRPDVDSGYVFFYRSGESDPDKQHPSFKKRVELKDKHLKDGDVSVILKNVTINDTGTYECYMAEKGRSSQLITTVTLTDGGDKDRGHVGLVAGLPVVALLLLIAAVVGFIIYRKHETHSGQISYQRPADEVG
ncbi:hypothetical protein Q5P01_002984 [Channa striata]|uniref:Ig-like domain-containing protein n=1 Tax=Channa striata TaxID=64152 RepID=A0AA88NNJ4_CHASR|nr:hypothetical protein Q5P01_002984 [Channa striata]